MAVAAALDTKPYVEHDPLIGYRYVPNSRSRLPRPGGGEYEIAINSAGIRSNREYTKEKPPGVFRILVFGDSYAAGQFVSNDQRFTELLERRVPGLEVINFALEGTGTDQQLLMYENVGREYEHDVVMVFPFLQNIRRNMVEARVARDPETHEEVLRPKPRFELVDGRLRLRNVPVPDRREVVDRTDDMMMDRTDANGSALNRMKTWLSEMPVGQMLKQLVFHFKPWEPFPEYRCARTPEWQLMEAILKRFREAAGSRPLVIVPVFYDSYVRFRMARNYWDRFCSLEQLPSVQAIDLLPHFRRLGTEAVRCFQHPHDCHYSTYGHLVVADALLNELVARELMPRVNKSSQNNLRGTNG